MKKKFLALLAAVLMLPVFSVFAAQVGWADSEMEGIYAVLGGEDAMTIRSRVSLGGKGGYCQALYAVELTGQETKAELDAAAVRLVKSGAKTVWGGSKHFYHGGSYTAQPEYTISASSVQPGSYLYVCYAFGCESGDNYNHVPVPCFDRISTMSVRITPKSQGMELRRGHQFRHPALDRLWQSGLGMGLCMTLGGNLGQNKGDFRPAPLRD